MEDLESAGGVEVNGVRVLRRWLCDGDLVVIGGRLIGVSLKTTFAAGF